MHDGHVIVVTSLALLAVGLKESESCLSIAPSNRARGPGPSPSSSACTGVRVPPGVDLEIEMGSHPAGTTYCLGAGTFKIGSPIEM